MLALLVVPDILQNYAIGIGNFSVLNFHISFSSLPVSQVCHIKIIRLIFFFFAYIYLYFVLIATTLSQKCADGNTWFSQISSKTQKVEGLYNMLEEISDLLAVFPLSTCLTFPSLF